jgi:hypothetical protein
MHYQEEDWFDFVRQIASPDASLAMQRHLDAGCGACEGTHATWQRVAGLAGREAAYEPPPDAVRIVKLAFSLSPLAKEAEQRVSFAKLLFDSLLQPLPAGVRSGGGPARHLLHQSGQILIDMRWESPSQIVGQVLNRDRPEESITEAKVWIFGGGKTCGSALTNSLGEFQISCDADSPRWLMIEIQGILPIATRLDA